MRVGTRRRALIREAISGAAAFALAAACRGGPADTEPCVTAQRAPAAFGASLTAGGGAPLDSIPSPFDAEFAAAATEFGVPGALLKSLAWVETRWQMVQGAEEFPGQPAAFGVMALRGAALERGAALAGVTPAAARTDPLANVRAAAALLAADAATAGISRSRPADWAPVVARYGGIEIAAGRTEYLLRVDRALSGRLPDTPAALRAAEPCPPPDTAGAPDYRPAMWRASPNFNQRPTDSTGLIHAVIIHTCEGNYTGCWSWLVNPVSQVSAHYVIDEGGAEVSQLVLERDRAWHIAALYDCSLNRGHECRLNGVQSNHFTVGIEHAGFASQPSFPPSQLEASASLVCDITRDHGIPRDWQHIVAHGQIQPQNRTDPGPNWPWVAYLHRVQARCGELVVDDSAHFNDAAAAAAVPVDWLAADATPDYYGAGYRWAPTLPDAADGAAFIFQLPAPGSRSVDARWTSGSNRSPRAAYAVIAATGDTLAIVSVDQRTGGGDWRPLGTWSFPAGTNRVVLLRRDTSGAVVVADAVRVRQGG